MKRILNIFLIVMSIASLGFPALPSNAETIFIPPPVASTTVQKSQVDSLKKAAIKTTPAVVSITQSKQIPVYDVQYETGFGDPYIDEILEELGITVKIPVYTETQRTQEFIVGTGSGFIISDDGYIATNKHVVHDPDAEYIVVLADGTEKSARVVYRDKHHDLAIVKINGTYDTIAKLGDSDELDRAQTVVAIGNAYGENPNSISMGNILAFDETIIAQGGEDIIEKLENLLVTNAPITPGYSGGPLITADGSVVGINVAKDLESSASYAIPINDVKTILQKFI
jgi:serine protease Do